MKVTFTKYTGPHQQKIPAIREFRNATGVTLLEAKEVVDALFNDKPIVTTINGIYLSICHDAGFISTTYGFNVIEELQKIVSKCLDSELFVEAASVLEALNEIKNRK